MNVRVLDGDSFVKQLGREARGKRAQKGRRAARMGTVKRLFAATSPASGSCPPSSAPRANKYNENEKSNIRCQRVVGGD